RASVPAVVPRDRVHVMAPIPATSRTTTTVPKTSRRRTGFAGALETGTVAVGVAPPLGVAIASSASRTSAAVCGLSAACFSRQRMTSAPSAGGTAARPCVTSTGGLRCVRGQHLLRRETGERGMTGEQLVAYDAQGVDIRPVVGVGIRRRLLG